MTHQIPQQWVHWRRLAAQLLGEHRICALAGLEVETSLAWRVAAEPLQAHKSVEVRADESLAAHGRLHVCGGCSTTVLDLDGIQLQNIVVDTSAALREVLGNLTFPSIRFQLLPLLFVQCQVLD